MNGGYIVLIGVTFTILLIGVQRIEEKRRGTIRRLVIFLALLLWAWRWHLRNEHIIGLLIAVFFSFLFWLLIGRYNPVGSSDDIRVFGMDD